MTYRENSNGVGLATNGANGEGVGWATNRENGNGVGLATASHTIPAKGTWQCGRLPPAGFKDYNNHGCAKAAWASACG